jgi:threonine aldolase
MIRFNCDYLEGAHPDILACIASTNMEQCPGYGQDDYCERAAELIRKKCGSHDAAVHFLAGGTGANKTVIAAALRPYEGVLCAATGHINVHETGAVEATGHKVLALTGHQGKINAELIQNAVCLQEDNEHTVKPGMVYLSYPTELGTLYSYNELAEIQTICKKHGLTLFIDGARLGYGLAADGADVTLQDICRLSDVFTIGGTKVGAMFGEAVVITKPSLASRFRYMIKQQGGMLAKGRFLGIQFETLMRDNLYESIARTAINRANDIRQAFIDKGIPLLVDSPTNQLFPILSNVKCEELSHFFAFETWEKTDISHTAVRICTSWATTQEQVNALIQAL